MNYFNDYPRARESVNRMSMHSQVEVKIIMHVWIRNKNLTFEVKPWSQFAYRSLITKNIDHQ